MFTILMEKCSTFCIYNNFFLFFSPNIVFKNDNKYKIALITWLLLISLVLLILVYAFYISWHGLHNQLIHF